MERRHFATKELRFSDNGSQPKISGYAATFNTEAQLPGFTEVIRRGAFDRALREKQDVVCLFQHDPNFVLGRTTSGTLRLRQDSKGLLFDCDLPPTQVARDLHTSIQRGDVNSMSFAFTLPHDGAQTWSQRSDGGVLREITDLNLHDVSPVTFPAYQGTSVDARVAQMAAEVRSRVNSVIRNNSLKGWRIEERDNVWRVYDERGHLFNTIDWNELEGRDADRRKRTNDLILDL